MQKVEFNVLQHSFCWGTNGCVWATLCKSFHVRPQQIVNFLHLLFFFSSSFCMAQKEISQVPPQLWREIALPSKTEDSLLNILVERHQKLSFVKRVILVEVNANLLREERVCITIGGHTAVVGKLLGEQGNAPVFTRYGELHEENGSIESIGDIFFAVNQGLIASKFYFDDEIYTLIPIYKQFHLLLQLKSNRLPNECGTVHFFGNTPPETPSAVDYRLRALVAYSQVAVSHLKYYSWSMTPEHFAQMAIGENNIAHWRNPKRIPHLSLEKVAFLSFSELEMKRDLNNLVAEKPPFDLLQRWRTESATDVQILIRSSEDALFGMARTEEDGWHSGRAFCVMTLEGYGFTPYSLAHQIEHLRPDVIESNHNTFAPSVFQSRLNQKNHVSGGVVLPPFAELNLFKKRFFTKHSIFYDENDSEEVADTDFRTKTENQFDTYWEIASFADFIENTHPTEELHQTIEIFKQNPLKKNGSGEIFRIMPNPTHGETSFEYRVHQENAVVQLDLVTLTGIFVAHFVNNLHHPVGTFTFHFDTSELPKGVYVCLLRIGEHIETLRLLVQ